MYRIYRFDTVHCPYRDGIIGSKATPLPMNYRSYPLAVKLRSRIEGDADGYWGGDTWYEVCLDGQPYHKNAHCVWGAAQHDSSAEIPF
jgi:hypothetical protein